MGNLSWATRSDSTARLRAAPLTSTTSNTVIRWCQGDTGLPREGVLGLPQSLQMSIVLEGPALVRRRQPQWGQPMGKHALGQRFFDLMGLKAYVLLKANIP